jgi:hypothetical protein
MTAYRRSNRRRDDSASSQNLSAKKSRSSKPESVTLRRKRLQRIIDKLQVLMLRRPSNVRIIESVLDGLLSENRHDDPLPDTNNGENGNGENHNGDPPG